jgi:hypothetical protein
MQTIVPFHLLLLLLLFLLLLLLLLVLLFNVKTQDSRALQNEG